MPRLARAVNKSQAVYVDAVRDLLKSKGIAKPVIHITQLLRVDLDGDGVDEVVLSATHFAGDSAKLPTPHSATAGSYSFVLLRRVVDGRVQTQVIDGEFYPQTKEDWVPNRYRLDGLLDLDGDGRLEIIVGSAYYEGGGTAVWCVEAGKINKVLHVECGA